MFRVAFALFFLLSEPSLGWTCDELLAAVETLERSEGLSPQQLISRALGGDGTGFCGTACLVNYEKLLAKLVGTDPSLDPIARAHLIAAEVERFFPDMPVGGLSTESIHYFVGQINFDNGLHAIPVTKEHVRRPVETDLIENYHPVQQLSSRDIVGTSPSAVPLSVVALHFIGTDGKVLGGHGALVVPIDPATKRVRVIDSRVPDAVIYATLVDDTPHKVPYLKFESPWYKNEYNAYLTKWRRDRGEGSEPVDIGEIAVTSVVSVTGH